MRPLRDLFGVYVGDATSAPAQTQEAASQAHRERSCGNGGGVGGLAGGGGGPAPRFGRLPPEAAAM